MQKSPEVSDRLKQVTVGQPQVRHNLTVFPLFAPWSIRAAWYLPFGRALGTGKIQVTEANEGGTVAELKLANNLGQCVLLIDGEELIGAKQNRIVNLTILAQKSSTIAIPVSCVERGRWGYRSRSFTDSPRAMYAKGRARKSRDVSSAMKSSGRKFSDQNAVWEDIDELSATYAVKSPTSAMSDVFESRQRDIEAYVQDMPALAGQIGAAFAVNGKIIGLELFDAEDTFAAYQEKIIRSYALDAMSKQTIALLPAGDAADVAKLIDSIIAAEMDVHAGVSVGNDVRFTSSLVSGGALVDDGRLVHLVAFGSDLFGETSPDNSREFRLEVRRDHILVHVSGGVALIDTGSPMSFGRGRPLTLEGRTWTPDSSSSFVLDAASSHLGLNIDWLLGGDILREHALLLDWNRGIAALPGTARVPGRGVRHRFDLVMGVPVIRGTHRGGSIRAVLDSGAALSYAPAAAVEGLQPESTYRDFYPGVGEFETPVWRLEVRVGKRTMEVRAGVLPPMLQMLFGALLGENGWIIGSDFFRDRAVLLDYSRGWVVDIPGQARQSTFEEVII